MSMLMLNKLALSFSPEVPCSKWKEMPTHPQPDSFSHMNPKPHRRVSVRLVKKENDAIEADHLLRSRSDGSLHPLFVETEVTV